MSAVQFTLQSSNAKTGPIPVSATSAETCPTACPLRGQGCYAESGPLGMLWQALSRAKPGTKYKRGRGTMSARTWQQFTEMVQALPRGTFWRHNQAGDLPGVGNRIGASELELLSRANQGRRGFTYTHKPIVGQHGQHNAAAIRSANAAGFTVNLSGNNLAHADMLASANVGPVVVVLPIEQSGKRDIQTPAGRRVVVCPATYRDDVTCQSCQLCQRQTRQCIVGFPAHGASKRKASNIAIGG